MDCTFDHSNGKSLGDWLELGWDLYEDGISLIPYIGDLMPFVDTIHGLFTLIIYQNTAMTAERVPNFSYSLNS